MVCIIIRIVLQMNLSCDDVVNVSEADGLTPSRQSVRPVCVTSVMGTWIEEGRVIDYE